MDLFVALWQLCTSVTYVGDLLRCPHKRIVTITKVFTARNYIHVQFIRFHKKITFIHVYFCEARGALGPLYVYSLFARWRQLAMNKLITIHSPDGSTPRYAHRNNALENLMDSEAGIVEVVLGTEFLTIAPLAMLT